MKTLFLALVLSSATLVSAQTGLKTSSTESKQETSKQVQNTPAFTNANDISKALEISEGEAKKVWIYYEQYNLEKQNLKDKSNKNMKSSRALSQSDEVNEKQVEAQFRNRLEMKRDRIDLDEKYYNLYLSIIPASKVQKLISSEQKAKKQERKRQGREHNTQPSMKQTR